VAKQQAGGNVRVQCLQRQRRQGDPAADIRHLQAVQRRPRQAVRQGLGPVQRLRWHRREEPHHQQLGELLRLQRHRPQIRRLVHGVPSGDHMTDPDHDLNNPPAGARPVPCSGCGGEGVVMATRMALGPIPGSGLEPGQTGTLHGPARCRVCDGRGWVWGPTAQPPPNEATEDAG